MPTDQRLSDLFHCPPLTVDAASGIDAALQVMSEKRISCLLVRAGSGGQGDICGIVTEKDLVRSYSGVTHHACRRVSDIMTTHLETVPSTMGHLEAYRLMTERRIRHLPVTDEAGKIIGIVTESDYVRGLGADYYVRLKDVASVMAPATLIEPGEKLRQALGLLARSDITCIVVHDVANQRLGILTERDVVRLLRRDVDADLVTVGEVMTSPVVTVLRDSTLYDASEVLSEHKIRRVVVVDKAGYPAGILSQHEIVKGLENEYIGHLEGVIVEKNKALAELSDARQSLETQSLLLRRMLDELSVAHSELKEFTKIAAHDLQEPLRRIMTYGQMLSRHSAPHLDEEGAGYLKTMLEQSDHARRLVQGLVGYSASMASLERLETISTLDAVEGAQALLRSEIASSEAVIVVDQDLPAVRSSRPALVEIFACLIGNALKFRHASRPLQIEVSSLDDPGYWHFVVSDNGIGIDEAYQETIFGLFARLHAVNAYPGSGVGLAICRRLAELAGGRVWVESMPDQGSRFHVTLAQMSTCPGQ